MALSRLRLRLAFVFTVTFSAGLALLSAVALGYLWRESHRRLDARLERLANDVRVNLWLESDETPDSSAMFVASEVVGEWPRNGGSFIVCDVAGTRLAGTDTATYVRLLERRCGDTIPAHFDASGSDGTHVRAAVHQFREVPASVGGRTKRRAFGVVAFASTAGISEDSELLLVAIGIAAPLILLFSLSGGYLMAARALRPVADLGTAISAIAPNELSHRLRVQEPRDELDAVASEFNNLLARLSAAQEQNRKFLREAAHQIRTPLTLVLGEADHALHARQPSIVQMSGSLRRIGLAAERMRRRVDELFLLAEAQTGEPVTLQERVELDGLALDAVDLMRPRSTALGRALAMGQVEPVVIVGNTGLLQEALLELLENALRHGDATCAVTVSVYAHAAGCVLEVASGGAAFELPVRTPDAGPQGLGLPIVRWVADVHGAVLTLARQGRRNVVQILFPTSTE